MSSSWIKKIYFNTNEMDMQEYTRSRRLFVYEGCAAMGIFSLTSGAFLAGLAEHLGASDEFNGIIGAIPALAGVVQIFASLVFERLAKRKLLISTLCFVFRLLLGLMFLIPIVVDNGQLRLIALAVVYSTANVLSSFISPPASNWIVDLVPIEVRGRYFARKDSWSLAVVTIVSLCAGKIMDVYRDRNAVDSGYLMIAVLVIVLAVMNFVLLSSIGEPTAVRARSGISLMDVIKKPLKNKAFRKIILLFVIWNIALQIAGPFFSVYMVTKLKLSYTYIMIMGVISSVVRVVLVVYWGRFADSKSWVSAAKLSILSLAICHGLWTLVDGNTMYLMVPLLNVVGGMAWAGINLSLFNIQFVFAPEQGRTMYLGLNAAIGGLIGFLSTLTGSVLLGLMSGFHLNFSIFSIGNIQILFLLSGILLSICALYIHVYIKDIDQNNTQCE